MASKEEFYQSINEDTFAGADFCRKLYGYCYTDDKFLEKVLDKFKSFGRTRVIYIYSAFVQTYIHFQMEREKEAAKWFRKQTDRDYERRVKEAEWKKKTYLRSLSDDELRRMLKEMQEKDGLPLTTVPSGH